MYSNIILHRQWSKLACLCRSLSTIEGQKLPQVGKSSDGITPPPRIPRGPTDILQALASTVGTDPTAAHYKYHDDPYLIPLSNFRKRSYALSAEAGRKAAAWVRDEHAELFTTREWDPPMKMKTEYYNADPQIDMYAPRPIYNDESKVTEEDLKYTINNALLEDAIKVFHLLGGVEGVNDELKLSLLQFLCFYNEKEPVSMEWIEERWFSAATRDRQAATWKLGGLADKIFEAMDPKTPEAYCAIIQGMAKYYQAERAHVLAKEAIEKGILLSTSVYNSLLGCVGFLKEGTALRIEALKSLLGEMNQQGFTPNKETLNSCLSSLSVWGSGKPLQTIALQILAEFRQLNIQPTLSSYYYLLCIFCKERGPRVDILTPILNDLEKRESLEATDATDTNFFITAMGVCSDHLQDVSLAERLHALLMKDDNYKLVGDAYKESIYYRHLVTVACRFAPFDKAMQLLDTLIPNVYVPEPSVMEEIIKTLELHGCGERLAGAWSQLVVFGLAPRTRLVERLLAALTTVYAGQDDETKIKIRATAADIVKFDQIKEEKDQMDDKRTPSPKLSATALTNILELCSDTTDKDDPNWEMVESVVNKLRSEQTISVPSNPQAIADVAEKAATVGLPSLASLAVTYLAECGFEEAGSASERALGVLLNRPPDEVRAILEQRASPALHPAAMQIVDAYHLAKTGSSVRDSSSDGTSSDSDSSSDDE